MRFLFHVGHNFSVYILRAQFLSRRFMSSRQGKGGSCVFYCKWDFYQFGSAKSLPFVIHLVAKQILHHTDTFLSAYCQHRNIMELIRTMFSKLSKSSSLDKRGSKSHPPASLLKGVHSVWTSLYWSQFTLKYRTCYQVSHDKALLPNAINSRIGSMNKNEAAWFPRNQSERPTLPHRPARPLPPTTADLSTGERAMENRNS